MTKINSFVFLERMAGVALLVLFLGSIWPILLLPFVNVMPYLHEYSTAERMLISSGIWLLILSFAFLTNRRRMREAFFGTNRDWKHKTGVSLGLLMFALAAGALNANTFGPLVKLFPNESYTGRFSVLAVASQGSKYRATTLDLQSNIDGRLHTLTLSERLFAYTGFHTGDIIILQGRQNIFGIYIERVTSSP